MDSNSKLVICACFFFFFSSRRRHTRCLSDWSSDVCSSDLDPDDEAQQLAGVAMRGDRIRAAGEGVLIGRGGRDGDRHELEIGRARVGKECRSRWSPYHEKKKDREIK